MSHDGIKEIECAMFEVIDDSETESAFSKQGLLYTWTDSLGTFFATFVIIKISVNDTNTICRSSKSITFPKIWRVWLKN